MKYLFDYTSEQQTKLMDDNGAFFAFSIEQLNEHKKEGVAYVSMGQGLIAPQSNAEHLHDELDSIIKKGIKQDIAENGIKAIIHRELGNHEAHITGCVDNTAVALADYGITRLQVSVEFGAYFQHCVENDLF